MIKKQILALKIYKNQEDFFQVGMIGLWEAYHRFDPQKGAFPAFAQTTVRGKMMTHLKKESQFEQRHVDFTDEWLGVIAEASHDDPLERELILSYCEGLTDKQLTWVIAGIIENKKPSDIAEEMGIPVDRVKGWRREALRKILGNYRVIHGEG